MPGFDKGPFSGTCQQMAPDVFETTWERLALVGALVTALGSLPVWFTLRLDPTLAELLDEPEQFTRGGIEGDGILTLLFVVLVVGTLVAATYRTDGGPGWRSGVVTLLSGVGATLLAVLAYLDLQSLRDQLAEYEGQGGANETLAESLTVDVHLALYVVLVGSVLVALAGLLGTVRELRGEETAESLETE
jgi:hypothetical protein